MENQIKGLKLLLIVVSNMEKTSEAFRDYLNSGSKKFWDKSIIFGSFSISLSIIKEEKLVSENNLMIIEECLKTFNKMSLNWDYTPNSREKQEGILEVLWEMKKEILKILKENITSVELSYFKNEFPESYDLLQTLVKPL